MFDLTRRASSLPFSPLLLLFASDAKFSNFRKKISLTGRANLQRLNSNFYFCFKIMPEFPQTSMTKYALNISKDMNNLIVNIYIVYHFWQL